MIYIAPNIGAIPGILPIAAKSAPEKIPARIKSPEPIKPSIAKNFDHPDTVLK